RRSAMDFGNYQYCVTATEVRPAGTFGRPGDPLMDRYREFGANRFFVAAPSTNPNLRLRPHLRAPTTYPSILRGCLDAWMAFRSSRYASGGNFVEFAPWKS